MNSQGGAKNWVHLLVIVAIGFVAFRLVDRVEAERTSGWGIDALTSTARAPADLRIPYLEVLKSSDIRWLRERSVGNPVDPESSGVTRFETTARAAWRDALKMGFEVCAFWSLPDRIPAEHPWNRLPEDLRLLYFASVDLAENITEPRAWEIFGEPDSFYLPDMPERVTAAQKAIYLGMKDGAAKRGADLIIMMGGLAHAPTPWLERAVTNGHYDYTDALNIHFYGHSRDFRDFIQVHREFAAAHVADRTLPIWVTEVGIDAVPTDDPNEPFARELQTEFTLETARVALDEGLSVFMPFVFLSGETASRPPDGHGMMLGPDQPFPAWAAYREFTRTFRLNNLPLSVPPAQPGRMVVQWMPDYSTSVPNKVSGAYWSEFGQDEMLGDIFVYNFSDTPVNGEVTIRSKSPVFASFRSGSENQTIEIPAKDRVRVPVRIVVPDVDYFRSEIQCEFKPQDPIDASIQASRVVFGVASRPTQLSLHQRFSIHADRPIVSRGVVGFAPLWPDHSYRITSREGPWVGINGVVVSGDIAGKLESPVSNARAEKPHDLSFPWVFELDPLPAGTNDKTSPPVAVTKVKGLPDVENGFLRIRMKPGFAEPVSFRLDLIDDKGRRFSIAENSGVNRFSSDRNELLLSYQDFHLYAWGRVIAPLKFSPSAIREIQIRLYSSPSNPPVQLQFDVLAP